jgi:RNA polymerase sigma factor (sigma-70 family)
MIDADRLTPRRERELVVAAEAGDADASRRLVEAFLPAITGVARRFPAGNGVEDRDLVQEGVAGLLSAARRYDPALGTPFWAYASFSVRKAMQRLVGDLTRPVALSDRAVRSLARIRAARNEYLQTHGVEPTAADLGRATRLTPAQLDSLLAAERSPRGIEERVSAALGTPARIGDITVDPHAEQAYEQVLDAVERREVRRLVDRLDERARGVIRAHYGLGQPPQTFTEIGAGLGLTAERARQIEVDALNRLREALDARPAIARAPANAMVRGPT